MTSWTPHRGTFDCPCYAVRGVSGYGYSWRPDCPEHGVKSAYYNSPAQVAERRERRVAQTERRAMERAWIRESRALHDEVVTVTERLRAARESLRREDVT